MACGWGSEEAGGRKGERERRRRRRRREMPGEAARSLVLGPPNLEPEGEGGGIDKFFDRWGTRGQGANCQKSQAREVGSINKSINSTSYSSSCTGGIIANQP